VLYVRFKATCLYSPTVSAQRDRKDADGGYLRLKRGKHAVGKCWPERKKKQMPPNGGDEG